MFAFPIERQLWRAYALPPVRVMQVRPDTDGQFTVTGLPPGGYHLAATTGTIPHRWQNPEFLSSLVPMAVKVNLGEDGRVIQNITLSSRK